jgi:hypothetical protein
MRTRWEGNPQQMTQCVCSIPCECEKRYIGKTGRMLAMQLHEHGHNLKLVIHAYGVGWDEATILEIENKKTYGKYKEMDHMAYLVHLITQPSLETSRIQILLISNEVRNSEGSSE